MTRMTRLTFVLLSMLAGASVWSYDSMCARREEARLAWQDAGECDRLAREIQALRTVPAVATTQDLDVQSLGLRVESAAQKSGLPPQTLVEIAPETARRWGDSAYLSKPTRLVLEGVPLEQLTTFLYHLAEGGALNVADLRLRTPHGQGESGLWNAEATVTYLIYAPAPRRGNGP